MTQQETLEVRGPSGNWHYYLVSIIAVGTDRAAGPIPAFIALISLWCVFALLQRDTLLGGVGLMAPFMFYLPLGVRLNVALIDFVLPALIAYAIVVSLRDNRGRKAEKSVLVYVVTFSCWIAISYIMSRFTGPSPQFEIVFLLDFLKILVCLVTLWCLTVLADKDFRRGNFSLLNAWVAMATVTAGLVVFEMLTAGGKLTRSTAGFEDPNLLGIYLLSSVGVVAVRGLLRGDATITWQTIVILAGVISTGSRGSMLAAAIVVVLLPFCSGGFRGSTRILLGVSSTITLVAAYQLRERIPAIQRLLEGGGLEQDIRSSLWAGAIDQWASSPLYGIGLGEYALRSPDYTGNAFTFVAHNTFLSFLAETGIVGLLIFVSVFVLVARVSVDSVAQSRSASVLLLSWIAVLVNMATVNGQNARFFWIFMALSVAAVWLQSSRAESASYVIASDDLLSEDVGTLSDAARLIPESDPVDKRQAAYAAGPNRMEQKHD